MSTHTMSAPFPPSQPTSPPASPASRRMIVVLALLFLLPVALGTGLFLSGWRPTNFSNHGTLLQPPVPLPESGLLQMNGQAMPSSSLYGQWLIVLPRTGACDAVCEETLQQIYAVHIALNKEQARVQRVFLRLGTMTAETAEDARQIASLEEAFPQMRFATVPDGDSGLAWRAIFAAQDVKEKANDPIFIVDPMGNAMMRYPDTANMRGVLKDLERLLKYSWIR